MSLGRGDEHWTRNRSYFRLDGKTTNPEREKLVKIQFQFRRMAFPPFDPSRGFEHQLNRRQSRGYL